MYNLIKSVYLDFVWCFYLLNWLLHGRGLNYTLKDIKKIKNKLRLFKNHSLKILYIKLPIFPNSTSLTLITSSEAYLSFLP